MTYYLLLLSSGFLVSELSPLNATELDLTLTKCVPEQQVAPLTKETNSLAQVDDEIVASWLFSVCRISHILRV